MHIIKILRDYMGITQRELACGANISQRELGKLERREAFGDIEKYQKIAEYFEIPLHPIVFNDCRLIPMEFFKKNKSMAHRICKNASTANLVIGRGGEKYVLQKEQERLEKINPVLAKLVIPYCMQGRSPGFDILSFDDQGREIYIEVKTTQSDRRESLTLTRNEQEKAEKLRSQGKTYQLHSIINWGKENQEYRIYDYDTLYATARIVPTAFDILLDPPLTVSGICYHRQRIAMSQEDLADALGITQSKVSLYENKYISCPADVLRDMSEVLETTVDELIQEYPLSKPA